MSFFLSASGIVIQPLFSTEFPHWTILILLLFISLINISLRNCLLNLADTVPSLNSLDPPGLNPGNFWLRSQGLCRVGTGESGLVFRWGMELCLPLELFTGWQPTCRVLFEPVAFSGWCNWGVSAPSYCDFILRVTFEKVPRNWDLSWVYEEISVFWNVARPTRLPPKFQCENSLLLRCDWKVGIPLQIKQGNRPSCQDLEGRRRSD